MGRLANGRAMEPMLVALYSIPKITLYPIILLVFGLGMSAKVAFGAIHGIIPSYLLMNAIGLYNVEVIMSVTFLLVVFAASVNGILLAIDRRLHFRA